eukprot:9158986-Pyramimonas_sp.AAC.1
MKTKGAETGVMVRWATHFAGMFADQFDNARELHAAGDALVQYLQIIRDTPREVPFATRHYLLDLCLRHLVIMNDLGLSLQPKSHQFVHLTLAIGVKGNPKYYSTFHDETGASFALGPEEF